MERSRIYSINAATNPIAPTTTLASGPIVAAAPVDLAVALPVAEPVEEVPLPPVVAAALLLEPVVLDADAALPDAEPEEEDAALDALTDAALPEALDALAALAELADAAALAAVPVGLAVEYLNVLLGPVAEDATNPSFCTPMFVLTEDAPVPSVTN